jgi:hypothetical protein
MNHGMVLQVWRGSVEIQTYTHKYIPQYIARLLARYECTSCLPYIISVELYATVWYPSRTDLVTAGLAPIGSIVYGHTYMYNYLLN